MQQDEASRNPQGIQLEHTLSQSVSHNSTETNSSDQAHEKQHNSSLRRNTQRLFTLTCFQFGDRRLLLRHGGIRSQQQRNSIVALIVAVPQFEFGAGTSFEDYMGGNPCAQLPITALTLPFVVLPPPPRGIPLRILS